MAKRTRMTEMEAYAVKTRKSEPVGSRGKGALLLERKASGSILAFYRERTPTCDNRLPLGTLAKTPRTGMNERDLDGMRAEAARISNLVFEAKGLSKYLEIQAEQAAKTLAAAESARREEEQLSIERQRQADFEASRGTFGEMLTAYVDNLEQEGKVSAAKVRSLFRVNVFEAQPVLAARYANEIQPEDITLILDDTLERKPKARGIGNKTKAPAANMRSSADELRRYLRTAFNFAAASHLATGQRGATRGKRFSVNTNPAALIPPIKNAGGGKTDSLTPQELGELLRHLDTLPAQKTAIAMALIYFGGQRIKQLLAATWDDISNETLSLLDSKGKKSEAWEHLLPITPRISEIIAPLLADKIAPGPFALTPGKLAHKDTVSHIFSDAGNKLAEAGKTRRFSWLEVRATVESLLAALGVNSEVRAWLLSHGRNGVQSKHYDRYSYLPEKRAALEQWGHYLDKLKAGEYSPTENVVLLSRRSL